MPTIIDEEVDHFSCHVDGTFHIKTKNGKQLYRDTVKRQEPLGESTRAFLDFIVFSVCEKVCDWRPKAPKSVTSCDANEVYVIRGRFSGASHPSETEMADAISHSTGFGFFLNGKTLKGVLFLIKMQCYAIDGLAQ